MADPLSRARRGESGLLVVDVQERLYPHIHQREALLDRVTRLVEACRLLGVPVALTEQYRRGLGSTIPELGTTIIPYPVFEKVTFSAFGSDELVTWLEETRLRTLLLCGIEAHICVQQTVLDALARGLNVQVAADCVGARRELDCRLALERMRQAGAVITTWEAIVYELLGQAATDEFRSVLPLLKR
ncbi:MAG: hydrolase [Chloroflexi bacterium]|nr:hydrolase [Chloroflexota bacterium]